MRRIRYSVAMSLDGYIAGANGEADWIVIDPDIDFAAMFKDFDTVLVGARSYAAMGTSAGKLFGMKTFVFSRTLQPRDHPDVTIVSQNVSETLAALRSEPGKDIWLFGGGILFRSLLDLGMVDAIQVVPVLLGSGTPLLPAPADKAGLKLVDHRLYPKTGTVLLQYEVGNEPASH